MRIGQGIDVHAFGPGDHVMLAGVRKFALIGCLVAGAVITPTTDPVNMLLFSGPLYLLYELGVVLSRVFRKREMQVLNPLKSSTE